jgi:hypothetical protein
MGSEHGENRVADGFFIGAGYRYKNCLMGKAVFKRIGIVTGF